MTQGTEVLNPEAKREGRAEAERVVTVCTPAMDIVERRDDVVLAVDLPGVAEDGLTVNVENGVLTITGAAQPATVPGMELVYGELVTPSYQRTVRLSERLNPAGITAKLRQGVLWLVVPKREEIKARRVPISAG